MGRGLGGGSLAACLPSLSPATGPMAPSPTLVARLKGRMCKGMAGIQAAGWGSLGA